MYMREEERERERGRAGEVRRKKKDAEYPLNTVIKSRPSIICLSPKAAAASSAAAPWTRRPRTCTGDFMNICF